MKHYYVSLVAFIVPGCLCGQEITGDAGFDSGIHRDAGPDAGDAGPDGGDAGSNGGDAGIDCSTTCSIGGTTYCANQVESGYSCYKCVPEESSSSWTASPIGTACSPLPNILPGVHSVGACYIPPVGSTEYCGCVTNGGHCWAPTACCFGTCQDSGITMFCAGDEGTFCNAFTPCERGECCLNPDGGAGVCSSDAGTCPG